MRYFIADTETTGLSKVSTPVEVAFVEIDERLRVLDARSSLLDPQMPIEEGASNIHGLYADDVAGQPLLADWMLANWPQEDVVTVIGHNISYDLRYLGEHIPVLGGTLCTLALARRFISGSLNHKLGTLAEFLELERGTAHRAAGDVITTLDLLRDLLERSGRTLPQAVEAATKPGILQIMPFGKFKGRPVSQIPRWYWAWLSDRPDLPADLRLTVDRFKNV
jgi:DNA polymerase III epsilon subunit-like protein